MASSTRTIRVRFDGAVTGLRTAAAQAQRSISSVRGPTVGLAKAFAVLGGAGSAVQVLAGAAAAAQQLAPAALLLPAALLAAGAAMATLKLATSGFSDAVSATDPAAFAEATKDMAPAAVATARAVRDLKPAFTDLRKEVQGKFFAGFSEDVKSLGSTYLPVLKVGLGGIASEFNLMGRSATKALLAPSAVAAVNRVLDGTRGLLGNMRDSLGRVVSGFLGLGAVGSTYLPRLGTAIDKVTVKFKAWVDQGVESGRINTLIDDAIAGFKDLGGILGNVGSILGSVFSGLSGGAVSSPLASLRDLTGALAEFFKSAEAQGPLKALGETMRVVAGVLSDVLLAALKALGPIVEALAPIVQVFAENMGRVLVAAFDKLGPPLTRLIDKLAPVLIPALQWCADVMVDIVIPALAEFIDWLATHIDDIQDFAQDSVIAFLSIGSAVLGFVSGFLGGMESVFTVLSYIPGAFGEKMGVAARATGAAKGQVDGLRGTVDLMRDKAIDIKAETQQARLALAGITEQIRNINGKTVSIFVNARGDAGGIASAGRLASGGNAYAGRSYLVGEAGPELLTMGGNGRVTPNGQLGGDTYVTVMIDGQEFRGMVRTEIGESGRQARRGVGAGSGRGV